MTRIVLAPEKPKDLVFPPGDPPAAVKKRQRTTGKIDRGRRTARNGLGTLEILKLIEELFRC
jgi:hypothetical protein